MNKIKESMKTNRQFILLAGSSIIFLMNLISSNIGKN